MNMCSYDCCIPDKKEQKEVIWLSSLLKLIAENSRLKLLCILRKGRHCVCELIPHSGMSQSLISHHLRDLKKAGLVSDRKHGQWVFYSLTKSGKRITNLIFRMVEK